MSGAGRQSLQLAVGKAPISVRSASRNLAFNHASINNATPFRTKRTGPRLRLCCERDVNPAWGAAAKATS